MAGYGGHTLIRPLPAPKAACFGRPRETPNSFRAAVKKRRTASMDSAEMTLATVMKRICSSGQMYEYNLLRRGRVQGWLSDDLRRDASRVGQGRTRILARGLPGQDDQVATLPRCIMQQPEQCHVERSFVRLFSHTCRAKVLSEHGI